MLLLALLGAVADPMTSRTFELGRHLAALGTHFSSIAQPDLFWELGLLRRRFPDSQVAAPKLRYKLKTQKFKITNFFNTHPQTFAPSANYVSTRA